MQKVSKYFFLSCFFISLTSCSEQVDPQTYILDISLVEKNTNSITSLSYFLPNEVEYVCNFPPYSHIEFVESLESKKMIEGLDILPVLEHEAYLVYFDKKRKHIGTDKFLQNRGLYQWYPRNDQTARYCDEINNIKIKVHKANDIFHINFIDNLN